MANHPTLEDRITQKLKERQESGGLRSLRTKDTSIDFCSNDYLGFANKLKPFSSSSTGSTGSRLISGNSAKFEELESQIALFHKAESGLIFNSGYDANLGLFSCLVGKGDTIIYDQYIHASIRDGIRLSHARAFAFEHNNTIALERKLQQATGQIVVAIESVYSMDGDATPINEIVEICEKYNAQIILDEAHATGVIGKNGEGLAQSQNLENRIFARVHTFGKAMGCHGAIVLGSENLKNYLINFSRSLIYTTALSEHSLNAIESAYEKLKNSTKERVQLQNNIQLFHTLLSDKLKTKLIHSTSPIQCLVVPGNLAVKNVEHQLQNRGFDIRAILHPTVEKGKERIRICIHSYNTKEEIKSCVECLEELIK